MSCIGNYEGIRRYLNYASELNSSKPRPKRYKLRGYSVEFKEGDWAFSLYSGWGKISILECSIYPILHTSIDGWKISCTKEGRTSSSYKYRSLFTVSEAKLLFNLEPPKEKDELDIMLEKAIEFYGTDVLKKGIKLLFKKVEHVCTINKDIDFKNKYDFFLSPDKNLTWNSYAIILGVDGEFRPIVLGYSNDKEPKPLVKGTQVYVVGINGGTFYGEVTSDVVTGDNKIFVSIEDAIEHGKTLRKLKVEITEAEYEMIKNMRNDSKTL